MFNKISDVCKENNLKKVNQVWKQALSFLTQSNAIDIFFTKYEEFEPNIFYVLDQKPNFEEQYSYFESSRDLGFDTPINKILNTLTFVTAQSIVEQKIISPIVEKYYLQLVQFEQELVEVDKYGDLLLERWVNEVIDFSCNKVGTQYVLNWFEKQPQFSSWYKKNNTSTLRKTLLNDRQLTLEVIDIFYRLKKTRDLKPTCKVDSVDVINYFISRESSIQEKPIHNQVNITEKITVNSTKKVDKELLLKQIVDVFFAIVYLSILYQLFFSHPNELNLSVENSLMYYLGIILGFGLVYLVQKIIRGVAATIGRALNNI